VSKTKATDAKQHSIQITDVSDGKNAEYLNLQMSDLTRLDKIL
jgi:hypothetical protein